MPLSSKLIAFAAKLDLGRKPMEHCGGPGLAPAFPRPKVWYPSFWIEGSDKVIDLPDSGKATITYKVTRRTMNDRDGQRQHEATVEVQSIEPMGGKRRPKVKPGTARVLDLPGFGRRSAEFGRRNGLTPGMIAFSRVRNGDGEFAPAAGEEGPGPGEMAKVYGPAAGAGSKISLVGKAAVAGGGLAAAALLARRLKVRGLRR